MSDGRTGAVLDARRLLASHAALEGFRYLAAAAREAGPDLAEGAHPLAPLGRGAPVTRVALERVIGAARVEALVECGAFELDALAVPSFGLIVTGRVVVPVPLGIPASGDVVYIGYDSASLVEAIWLRARGGERAVDLGSGTGFLAAVLTSRYELVVATEVVPRAAAVSALTLAINPPPVPRHRAAVCVADVAGGLRPASFDLVAANPPWVPGPSDPAAPRRVFADGGPTGFELPLRFIREGTALLRPGGMLAMTTLDATHHEGARPLEETRAELEAEGYETEVAPTRLSERDEQFEPRLVAKWSHIVAARHVTRVVRRPG
jgi:methylase of polypeptide subunit release factors